MKDYYATLGVMPDAEMASIKGAYHGLASKYHPDKFQGNVEESHRKMLEINEAWEVLSDPKKKNIYDKQRSNPIEKCISELSLKELDVTQDAIPELPEIPLNQFSSRLVLWDFKISKEQALQKFKFKFESIKKTLPKNIKIDSAILHTRTVLFPHWRVVGSANANWRASGIVVDKKEVNCGRCRGSGETGSRQSRQRCQSCKGTGKTVNFSEKKVIESGSASFELSDALPNFKSEIDFNIPSSALTNKESNTIPNALLSSWKCISPISTDVSDGEDKVKDILALGLIKDVKDTLSIYDRVDDIQFENSTIHQGYVIVSWLYPAYICWFEVKGKKYYATCDAVTGQVEFPCVNDIQKQPNSFLKIIKKVLSYFLGFVVLLILGSILIASFSTNNEQSSNNSDLSASSLRGDTSQSGDAIIENPSLPPDATTSTNNVIPEQQKHQPSFDCNRNLSEVEYIICSDAELSNLDIEYATIYEQKKSQANDIDSLELRAENCHDKECIKKWYIEHIDALNKVSEKEVLSSETQSEIQQNESASDSESSKLSTENSTQPTCNPGEKLMHSNGC